MTAQTAPASNTAVIEVALPTQPPTRTPTGTVPPNPMIHSAITRPRSSSTRCAWINVDSAVIATKYAYPRSTATGYASAATRISANPASTRANAANAGRNNVVFETLANIVPTLTAPSTAPTPKQE